MRAERFRPLLAAALLWLAGCGTTEERPDDKAELLGPPSQRIDLPDFEYQWDSIDRDERGGREPFAVARWVTERQNAVSRCLAAEPPAWEQAREVLDEVVRRIPDASRVRLQLGQLHFQISAYWFRTANRVASEIDRLNVEKTEDGKPIDDSVVQARIAEYRPYFERARDHLHTQAALSLRHISAYRTQRPDDRSVLDLVWKLYLYLEDYDRALEYLDLVLHEFDAAEVPQEEPLRKDYVAIKKALSEFLAQRTLQDKPAEKRDSVLPWQSDDRLRGRLGEAGSPSGG